MYIVTQMWCMHKFLLQVSLSLYIKYLPTRYLERRGYGANYRTHPLHRSVALQAVQCTVKTTEVFPCTVPRFAYYAVHLAGAAACVAPGNNGDGYGLHYAMILGKRVAWLH